jgi:acyl transferase domain-containing protein
MTPTTVFMFSGQGSQYFQMGRALFKTNHSFRQARAFEESCEVGGMTAVLADAASLDRDFLPAPAEVAGVNFCSHFVLSAKRAALAEIEAVPRQRNIHYQRGRIKRA